MNSLLKQSMRVWNLISFEMAESDFKFCIFLLHLLVVPNTTSFLKFILSSTFKTVIRIWIWLEELFDLFFHHDIVSSSLLKSFYWVSFSWLVNLKSSFKSVFTQNPANFLKCKMLMLMIFCFVKPSALSMTQTTIELKLYQMMKLFLLLTFALALTSLISRISSHIFQLWCICWLYIWLNLFQHFSDKI